MKIKRHILSSLGLGFGIALFYVAYNIWFEHNTGFSMVSSPIYYILLFFANAFLIFICFVMLESIEHENKRRFDLKALDYAFIRIIAIITAWFILLIAVGVWVSSISMGRSVLFMGTVVLAFVFTKVKIWQFRR